MFTVTGEECGCESTSISPSTTSVSCSDWTASGQTCFFEVRTVSQVCGFTSDPVAIAQAISLRGEFLTLAAIYMHFIYRFTVLSSPTELQVMTMYNQYGSTDYIEVHFMGVVS